MNWCDVGGKNGKKRQKMANRARKLLYGMQHAAPRLSATGRLSG